LRVAAFLRTAAKESGLNIGFIYKEGLSMYFRKRSMEEFPQEQTKIWSCSQEDCKGWMRDNFAFEYAPTCHICQSSMVSSLQMLPIVGNSNVGLKLLKKGVQI
jgi:hypothetical protein